MTEDPIRNVLFIIVDQWRGDSLGALGHRAAITPNLDRLARVGVVFRRHFGQGAPCSPARASMLTGLYVMNHRVVTNGVPLDDRHATLPRELRRAGIEPALIGYTTTTHDPRRVSPGDPRYRQIGEIMDGWRVIAHFDEVRMSNYFRWVAAQGHPLPADPQDLWLPADGVPGPTALPAQLPASASDTAWSAGHALAYLKGGALAARSVLHLGFYRPHPPFVVPAPFHDRVPEEAIAEPVRAASVQAEAAQHPMVAEALGRIARRHFFRGAPGLVADMSAAEVRTARRTYYGLIAETDHAIGQVLDEMERSGAIRDTLIVFTSDHGEQLGDHHLFGKLGYFDESYHVPLIIHDPRASADASRGTVIDAFTEGVDLMPTILDCLGLEVPHTCDGRSLQPFLRGDAPAGWRDAAHFEFDLRSGYPSPAPSALGLGHEEGKLAVWRDHRFKYVHFQELEPVLFDLARDPQQLTNVAADPAYGSVVAEYAQKMLSWRMRHLDRTLTHLNASSAGLVDRLRA